jgi:fatty-acyl-CoA synthase
MDTLPAACDLDVDLISCLNAHAATACHRPFLVILASGGAKQFTYGDALLETRRWAGLLQQAGARAGDRVFIALKHSEEVYFAFLGAMWNGSIPTIIPFPTPKQDAFIGQSIRPCWRTYSPR